MRAVHSMKQDHGEQMGEDQVVVACWPDHKRLADIVVVQELRKVKNNPRQSTGLYHGGMAVMVEARSDIAVVLGPLVLAEEAR